MSQPILPDPPEELKQLSHALARKIRLAGEAQGFLSFAQYMEMALYEPGLGYYSAGLHKLGAGGDFITAPELGTLFAACVARQVGEIAQVLGDYDILEIGAGTGKLAADVLKALPHGRQPQRYLILERSADLQSVQQRYLEANLPDWQDRVKWLSRPPESSWSGVLLANEVVDALSVERFRLAEHGVEQLGVGFDAPKPDKPGFDGPGFERHGFTWRFRPAPEPLEQAVSNLGIDVPVPYTSELNLHLPGWLQAVTQHMHTGVALMVDYGYPRSEYYRPDRRDGTMMCHFRHRAHDDVFFWPGLQDITSFVDFTALAEAADSCGLDVAGYTSQTLFLLSCGLDRVLGHRLQVPGTDTQKLNNEARQLTLPTHMGERFGVMALTRNYEESLRGFELKDLRHRL